MQLLPFGEKWLSLIYSFSIALHQFQALVQCSGSKTTTTTRKCNFERDENSIIIRTFYSPYYILEWNEVETIFFSLVNLPHFGKWYCLSNPIRFYQHVWMLQPPNYSNNSADFDLFSSETKEEMFLKIEIDSVCSCTNLSWTFHFYEKAWNDTFHWESTRVKNHRSIGFHVTKNFRKSCHF